MPGMSLRTFVRKHATPNRIRHLYNLYGPYRGAGIKVTHISHDWRELRVRMKLNLLNRNYVGTQFGGSLYSMVDPHFMLMLMNILGPGYIVWDKSASIEFVKPGKGPVHAEFQVTDEQIDAIIQATASGERHLPRFAVEIKDEKGTLIATVEKVLYVRRKKAVAA